MGAKKENPPLLIRTAQECSKCNKKTGFKVFILLYTFLIYISFHMSRLPISIVKSVLHRNCSHSEMSELMKEANITTRNLTRGEMLAMTCSWVPFEGTNYEQLYGFLDYAFLLCYAIGLFISGQIAERSHIRYFLTAGMITSGILVILFGLGHAWKIHYFYYYLSIQILSGFAQSSGWPCVVTCVANWMGGDKKGLIMGAWNSHTNIGNILGAIIPGIWVDTDWGLSFVVPGIIILVLGITVFFLLIPYPGELGFPPVERLEGSDSAEMTSNGENNEKNEKQPNRKGDLSEDSYLMDSTDEKAITILGALKIPGVIEFALSLFFIKLVNYTFLFWLPKFISSGGSAHIDAQKAASLTALYDVGGMMGGAFIGLLSDIIDRKAILCVGAMAAGTWPMIYQIDGSANVGIYVAFLIITGFFVYAPYALILTAVSAELGTHPCLKGNAKAMSTVAAILDGTGSLGAAFGPLITGLIAHYGWDKVFTMLMLANLAAALMLSRLAFVEIRDMCRKLRTGMKNRSDEKKRLIDNSEDGAGAGSDAMVERDQSGKSEIESGKAGVQNGDGKGRFQDGVERGSGSDAKGMRGQTGKSGVDSGMSGEVQYGGDGTFQDGVESGTDGREMRGQTGTSGAGSGMSGGVQYGTDGNFQDGVESRSDGGGMRGQTGTSGKGSGMSGDIQYGGDGKEQFFQDGAAEQPTIETNEARGKLRKK